MQETREALVPVVEEQERLDSEEAEATNALITSEHAPSIPKKNITAKTGRGPKNEGNTHDKLTEIINLKEEATTGERAQTNIFRNTPKTIAFGADEAKFAAICLDDKVIEVYEGNDLTEQEFKAPPLPKVDGQPQEDNDLPETKLGHKWNWANAGKGFMKDYFVPNFSGRSSEVAIAEA